MSATILIRHLSNSSLAGQSREYHQDQVSIGRKPDNDIVFNPELDRTVSGHHCQIVAENGALYLTDRGSTNGTFVNGQRLQERRAITERDQIVLGERGPVIAVSLKSANAAGPSTIMGDVPAAGMSDVPHGDMATPVGLLDAGAKHPPPGVAATMPAGRQALAVDAPIAPPPLPNNGDDALSIGPVTPAHTAHPHRPLSRLSQGIKTSIGMNTLMAELSKATSRERRRIFLVGVPIVLLLMSGIGVAWYFTRPGPAQVIVQAAPTQPALTLPALPPEWSAVLAPRKSSVYLIVEQQPGKEERGVGTAWSVKKGLLATNAHVAKLFNDKPANVNLIARSNSNPPVDLKIVGATLHPAYEAFSNLVRTHLPVDLNTGEPIRLAMPFDTGLFVIDGADHDKQFPPLELADREDQAKVVETTELAYIGFPMESSVESGVNVHAPVAHQFLGNLTRKTDNFLAATTEDRAILLQYTLVVQGGASGSPVFNRDGKVIGLISGNDHFIGPNRTRIAITGKSFGPRVDAITTLLDQTAEARSKPYIDEWRAHFRTIYDKALATDRYGSAFFQTAFKAFSIHGVITRQPNTPLFNPPKADKVKTWEIEIADVGQAGEKSTTSFPLTDAGVYCVVVWTDNPDVLPKVTLSSNVEKVYEQAPAEELESMRQLLGNGGPYVASWAMPRRVGDTFKFTVSGIENGPTTKAKFTAVLMKAKE